MARSLNKSRILWSKAVGLIVLLGIFLTDAVIKFEGFLHETLDMAGLLLVSICALGRLYTTAYLGGSKNEALIAVGPFSVVRNPLYVFSWIGFTGVAMMTGHMLFMIAVPIFFLALYHALVSREEAFLEATFGQPYRDYKKAVPRFVPNFFKYKSPAEIKVRTDLLMNAFLDSIWWFAAYPAVELAEYIQEQGLINPLFVLP